MKEVDISSVKSRYLSAYRKAIGFEDIMEKYTEKFLSSLSEFTSDDSIDTHINSIQQTIGFIVNDKLNASSLKISKKKASDETIKFWSLFNDCWRQYSHTKFEELIKSNLFRFLFLYFSNFADDSFFIQISAVNSNIDVYKQVISQIKEIVVSV